jgi:hypothetical protein
MRPALPRAASAAAIVVGSALFVGCASSESVSFPASPVPAPLSDKQSIAIASEYLDQHNVDEPRMVNSVRPFGDGNLVSFRTGLDAGARPPVQTRLVMVKHDGSAREIAFRKD